MKKYTIIFLILLSSQLSAQIKHESLFTIEPHQITEDVFVMVRPDWLRMFVVGNVSVVSTEDGLVLFDAGNGPTVAKQVIKEIQKKTDLPVKYIIISHGHIDHTGGIETYRKVWPNLEIIGHKTLYPYMKRDIKRVKRFAQSRQEAWLKRDSIMNEVRTLHKNSPAVVQYFGQYYNDDIKELAEEYKMTNVILPTITFNDSLQLWLGNRKMEIFKAGNANTPSDILLYLPNEKILFTGDVVTRPVPYGFTSHGEEWFQVLEDLKLLDIEWIVPGHGEPLKGKEYLNKLSTLFNIIIQQIEEGIIEGISEEEIRSSISLGEISTFFTQGDPVAKHRFETWFLDPFVSRNYKALQPK